jgi:hypothetical protein
LFNDLTHAAETTLFESVNQEHQTEKRAGNLKKQAVAIAMSVARKAKRKAGKQIM